MGESEQDADSCFDDNLPPGLSTPEWVAKFAKVPVNPGTRTESTPCRVTHFRTSTFALSYRRLSDQRGADSASAEAPPSDTAEALIERAST